jgi:hypothetical protein
MRAASSSMRAGSDFKQFLEQVKDEPVYVILGVQGSGTNLLAKLLSRLFSVSVVLDRSMVFNAAVRLGHAPPPSAVRQEIRRFEESIAPSALRRKIAKNIIRNNRLFDGVVAELEQSTIRSGSDFARLIYAYRAFSRGFTRIAIKSDDMWENLHRIDDVLPNRRVVFLTRDFRDNLVSITGKNFGPIEPLCAARYVKDQLALYATEYRRAGSNGYHVKFETLLNATREFVDDFARHFKLAPTANLDVAIPALQFKPNRIGRWARLSPRELAWCEGMLREELLEFGYPLASPSPTLPPAGQVAAANVRDTFKRFPQKIRRMIERTKR